MNNPSEDISDSPNICRPSHVNRLAPELWISIFEHIADADGDICTSAIICVSHVCLLWRKVALATPSLWTSINVRYSGYSTIATRSYPRTIAISLIERNDYNTLDLVQRRKVVPRVMELINRAESLTVEGSFILIDAVFDRAPLYLPKLRRLKLICKRYLTTVPSFEHNAPNLKQLCLSSVTMDLAGLSLTTFKLQGIYQQDKYCPSMLDIAQLLQRSPSMRHFSLKNLKLHPISMPTDSLHQQVGLGQLESFILHDIDPCLSCVHIPLRQIVPDSNPELSVVIVWSEAIYILKVMRRDHRNEWDNPVDFLRISDTVHVSSFPSAVNNMLAILDCQPIQKLQLWLEHHGTTPVFDVSQWNWVLSQMPCLEKLQIEGNAGTLRTLMLALWPDSGSRENAPPRLPCPHLTKLILLRGQKTLEADPGLLGPFLLDRLRSPSRLSRNPLRLFINFGAEMVSHEIGQLVQGFVHDFNEKIEFLVRMSLHTDVVIHTKFQATGCLAMYYRS